MSAPTHITVTAPPGRKTPVHADDGTDPGGGVLYVEDGCVCRVRFSQAIRRSIARDDMFPCDMDGARVASAHLADAPTDTFGSKANIARGRSPAKKGPQ